MDIGCDLVLASRYAFQSEPNRVIGCLERDPRMQTDRLTSAILDFPTGPAVFTRSTQLVPYQWVQFFGGLKGGLRLRSLSMLLWIVPLAFLLTMVLICLEVASRRRPSLSRPVRYPRRCLFQGHPGGYRGADALGRGNQKYGCYWGYLQIRWLEELGISSIILVISATRPAGDRPSHSICYRQLRTGSPEIPAVRCKVGPSEPTGAWLQAGASV